MRDLTKQEIDDAPEWSDGYYWDDVSGLAYLNIKKGTFSWSDSELKLSLHPQGNICKSSKPIPRKEFDIKDHLNGCYTKNMHLLIHDISDECLCVSDFIYKEEAILIAKHFNLTMDDLK